MVFGLFQRKKTNAAIVKQQYEQLTEAARREAFYTGMNVPDTVMGRFNMLTIHLTLYLRRIAHSNEAAKGLAQDIIDAFFEDVDHSIRELGIGDASVPKRMKKLAKMFYGRAEKYGSILDQKDEQGLSAALVRNIFPEIDDAPDLSELAKMMRLADESLAQVDDDQLARGQLKFPDI